MNRREGILLLALLASFTVAGYAGVRLLAGNPVGVGAWFVGSAVVHDVVLFPLYAGLDAALVTLLRRRPALAHRDRGPLRDLHRHPRGPDRHGPY